jgi:hypothetical protein
LYRLVQEIVESLAQNEVGRALRRPQFGAQEWRFHKSGGRGDVLVPHHVLAHVIDLRDRYFARSDATTRSEQDADAFDGVSG